MSKADLNHWRMATERGIAIVTVMLFLLFIIPVALYRSLRIQRQQSAHLPRPLHLFHLRGDV